MSEHERIASTRIRAVDDNAGPVTVRFETVRPQFEGPPRAIELSSWQCFEGIVLALVFSDGSRHSVLGSAVTVAPRIAMCATHTIRDFVPKLQSGTLDLAAIGIASYGLQVWRARYITSVEKTDISILTLSFESQMPPNHTFRQAMITTRLPSIGEPVVFGGFRAARDEFLLEQPGTIDIQGAMRLGSGVVTQAFPRGRDRLLVPWPALEIDAPLFGGMSGGPVFDSRGGLIGLGSRSMEMGVGNEPSPMIVALLWPVLGQTFPLDADPSLTASLLDLHRVLTIIERPDAVSAETTADGVATTYTPWT